MIGQRGSARRRCPGCPLLRASREAHALLVGSAARRGARRRSFSAWPPTDRRAAFTAPGSPISECERAAVGTKRPGSCVSVVSSDAPSRDSGRLGEAVVSGSVTPDHYLLDDQGRIHHFQPGQPGSAKRLPDHGLEQRARLGIAVARSSGARKILSGRTPMITCGCGRRPVDRLVPVSPRPTLDVLAALWRLATLAYRNSQHRWTDDPRFAEFLAGVRSLAAQELATMRCSWLKKMHGGQEIYQAHRRPANRLPASHRPRAAGAVIVLRLLRRSALPDLLAAATTRPPITCPGSGSKRSGERFEVSAEAMVDLADCVIGAVQDLGDLVVRPVEALPQYEDSALQRGQVTPSTPARQTTGCLLGYDLAGPGRG